MSGDATIANTGAVTVVKINGATVPAAGGLITGNVLQVNGISSVTYAPVNIAGGANYITGILPTANGGMGANITAGAIGAIPYSTATTTYGTLADVATGNAMISGGIGAAPSWGKIGLTTHVTGTLPIANGGTNSSTALSGSSIMV